MRVTCKNAECKHYYELKNGEHCKAEGTCKVYMTNRKKAEKRIMKCKDCEYCKVIYSKHGKEYHYECTCNGRNRTILLVDGRRCDYRVR